MTLNGTQISEKTITVVIDGIPHSTARNQHILAELNEILAEEPVDEERLLTLVNPLKRIEDSLDGSGVTITHSTVAYKGKVITGHLADRLLDIASSGLDVTPWKKFIQRVYSNPLDSAREELLLFLESGDLPLTPDGNFIAYKKVTEDYKDIYSKTFDNSVGKVVEMQRKDVDNDRSRTCSNGLHFCSKSYLSAFGSGPGDRVVLVEIDPADVVAIPKDYNNAKGRTSKYKVVGEVEVGDTNAERHEWGLPVVSEYSNTSSNLDENGWDEDADYDYYDDETEEEFLDTLEENTVSYEPTYMQSKAPEPRKSFWRKAVDIAKNL